MTLEGYQITISVLTVALILAVGGLLYLVITYSERAEFYRRHYNELADKVNRLKLERAKDDAPVLVTLDPERLVRAIRSCAQQNNDPEPIIEFDTRIRVSHSFEGGKPYATIAGTTDDFDHMILTSGDFSDLNNGDAITIKVYRKG